jgi:hypothetical protein
MPELLQESLAGTMRIKEMTQSLRVFARGRKGSTFTVYLPITPQ